MHLTKTHYHPLRSEAGPVLDAKHSFHNSVTCALPPERVYEACQASENIDRILADLPSDLDNFLNLELSSTESLGNNQYRVVWENAASSKVSGTVTFLLTAAPGNLGTWLTGEAAFEKFNLNDEGPSTLMNLFLKRLKALIETGEVPTTKGQPTGREEVDKEDRS